MCFTTHASLYSIRPLALQTPFPLDPCALDGALGVLGSPPTATSSLDCLHPPPAHMHTPACTPLPHPHHLFLCAHVCMCVCCPSRGRAREQGGAHARPGRCGGQGVQGGGPLWRPAHTKGGWGVCGGVWGGTLFQLWGGTLFQHCGTLCVAWGEMAVAGMGCVWGVVVGHGIVCAPTHCTAAAARGRPAACTALFAAWLLRLHAGAPALPNRPNVPTTTAHCASECLECRGHGPPTCLPAYPEYFAF